jgi:hypothetical protein
MKGNKTVLQGLQSARSQEIGEKGRLVTLQLGKSTDRCQETGEWNNHKTLLLDEYPAIARRVQRQATPNRAQEQERARTKKKKNKEQKLLAFYVKLQEAEARLGQDEEPSVQNTILDEKLRQLAENDFDYNIFLDNPVMEAGKKMHK